LLGGGLEPRIVYLQPGQTGEFSLEFANLGDTTSDVSQFRASPWVPSGPGRLTISSLTPSICTSPQMVSFVYHYEVSALEPGASATCRFSVFRPLDSRTDETTIWHERPGTLPAGNYVTYKYGTPVDVRMSSQITRFERRADGIYGTVRVSVSNLSDIDLVNVGIVICGSNVALPFDIDPPEPGGCSSTLTSPGSPSGSFIFCADVLAAGRVFGNVPAGATRSCGLSLRAPLSTSLPATATAYGGDYFYIGDDRFVTHVGLGTGALVVLGPPLAQSVPIASSARLWAWLAGAALLLGLAALRARR
jgi:hypothetical protein